jgi:hypothetical protein
MCSFYADSQIDREMLNILEENARLLNQIEINIFTSQVGLLFRYCTMHMLASNFVQGLSIILKYVYWSRVTLNLVCHKSVAYTIMLIVGTIQCAHNNFY